MNTEIILIADVSGSMQGILTDAVGGIKTFIEEQRKVPGAARISLFTFNSHVEHLLDAVDIQSAELPELRADGMTALNDAMGMALESCGKRIAEEKWADKVIVMITTDGMENASTDYTPTRVREMVRHAEDNGWQFIFAAANQDAVMSAQSAGITRGMAANYSATAQGTRDLYATMSMSVTSMRASADNIGAVTTPVSSLTSSGNGGAA